MKNSWIIAVREFQARIGARSFVLFSILGPIVILGLIYVLFALGGESKQHWNVLVADKYQLLDGKMMPQVDPAVSFSFADDYIEIEEFKQGKRYQEFDALLEVNEKVLSNKTGFVFYRDQPSVRMQSLVRYYYERRLEERIIDELKTISLAEFRKVKQPINLSFRDVEDPKEEASSLNGWAGLFFGTLIFVFIFLFGMTILRSVSREKSNRIVEVLLASVSPRQLMIGKIVGIGLAAFLQFVVWVVVIGAGLYLMRETLFPDLLDASNMNIAQLTLEAGDQSYQEQYFAAREYNEFVDLVFSQLQFGNSLVFFLLFFIGGYLFYGAFFAAIGATMGSESDGQQFVIPIIILLIFSLYAGYYAMNYPESQLTAVLHYLPFTSPVVAMVKLHQGYAPGHAYEIVLTLLMLLLSAIMMLSVAARLYKNGILQFGHRLRLKHLFKWIKTS